MSQPERVSPKHETVMDVTVEQLARVYAKAFINVAAKSADADGLVQELNALVAEVLDRFPQFEQTLESSLIPIEQKEELLDRVFGKRVSPQLLVFLKVVARHERLALLRSIARQVQQLNLERSSRVDVEIRVATPIDDEILAVIQHRVQNALDKTPVLHIKVDPSLVAGIVVRVGDRLFDGSVQTQLENTRRLMIDRATESIEMHPERFHSAATA